MDPSTNIDWQWFIRMQDKTQKRVACILWTLYEHGPVEDITGAAPSALADLLRARKGPYAARGNEPPVHQMVFRIVELAPGLIVRDKNKSRTFRLALRPDIGPDDLPPNPYADQPTPPSRPAVVQREPLVAVEATVVAEPAGPTAELAAVDALAAVASFVESALRMAGVTMHDITPDERLDEALAECRRLQESLDHQGEQLLTKMRENEVLRRALAKRNGAVAKGTGR
jgi:hypothetical protein